MPFFQIIIIDNDLKYLEKSNQFEEHLKEFYDVRGKLLLTKGKIGDDETFYMHCLRLYLPHISKKTLKEHSLGLGVLIMQGFEHQNKTSKQD